MYGLVHHWVGLIVRMRFVVSLDVDLVPRHICNVPVDHARRSLRLRYLSFTTSFRDLKLVLVLFEVELV